MELSLTAHGYQVNTAGGGEDALVLASEQRPDLILLDMMMPGLNGLETLKLLAAHPDLKKVPVILVSAALPLTQRRDSGWVDFMQKPFALPQLIAKIEKYIQR